MELYFGIVFLVFYTGIYGLSKIGNYPGIHSVDCGLKQLVSGSVAVKPSVRIVNGQNVTAGEFPWMVFIFTRRVSGDASVESFCGGALINDHFVITAANCFSEPDITVGASVVIAGTNDRSKDRYFSHIKDIVIHEQFNRTDTNGRLYDIALVELATDELRPQFFDESVSKKFRINTVCLPVSGLTNKNGEMALFSGFGETDVNYKPENRPNVLLKKNEYLLEDSTKCDPKQLCSHERVHPSCWGDTGSPLVQFEGNRAVLIGILVSVGNQSKNCGQNWHYFTRISYFVDWIRTKIRIIQITEDKTIESKSETKSYRPSVLVLILVFIIVFFVCLSLTTVVFKLKSDSDKYVQNPVPIVKHKNKRSMK